MVSDKRIAMRNDFKGPPNGSRPLLRLSRFGGGGVFYIPANQQGYAHAVDPRTARATPVILSAQGGYQRHGPVVTTPLPTSGARGDARGLGFRLNAYAPPRNPMTSRAGFFARRAAARKCPHCGGNLG